MYVYIIYLSMFVVDILHVLFLIHMSETITLQYYKKFT